MIGTAFDPFIQWLTGASTGTINPPPDPETGGGDTGGGTGGGGGPDPDPVATPATLSITPAARWHAEFSTVVETNGRVSSVSDLTGLAALTETAAGLGPKAMTDANGAKFWRFEGYEYLTAATSLVLASRDMAVFFVGRFHRVTNKCPVFSLGSNAAGTQANTLGAALEASVLSRSAPMLRSYSYPRNSTFAQAEWMVAGSQMQVAGISGRSTADGATGLWINNHRATTTQPYGVTGIAGAEVGRYANTPGAAGGWGTFDLYEMIVCDTKLTDAQGDTLTAELMAHYGIVPVTNQLVLEGDSIMQGTDQVTSGLAANMVLTDPGAALIGADWRVVNMASSGNQVSDLVLRRDATSGWPILQLPGQNVMAVEIGRNDFSAGKTPAQHYAALTAYLNTTTTGILNRGWTVRVMANIASGSSFEADIDAFRLMLRAPAFLTDTGSGASQPFAGNLSLIDTDLIHDGGNTVFATTDDAADVTYYVGDSTHPSILGTALRMSGGDDPAKGVAHGL